MKKLTRCPFCTGYVYVEVELDDEGNEILGFFECEHCKQNGWLD